MGRVWEREQVILQLMVTVQGSHVPKAGTSEASKGINLQMYVRTCVAVSHLQCTSMYSVPQ